MSDWRFYSVDALSRLVRDELPLSGVQITERLNAPGAFSASIPNHHPKATRANLDTENTLVAAVRDDALMFVYELLSVSRQPNSETVTLGGDGIFGLLRARHLRSRQGMTYATNDPAGGIRWDQVDQFRIVEDLVAHTQSLPGGDLGIQVGYHQLSGRLRDRTYELEASSIGTLIEQLAAVQDGFDFMIDASGTINDIHLTLRLDYPWRGRATNYRFDADQSGSANLRGWGLEESARDRVNRFVAVGSGEGVDQLIAAAEDPNLITLLPLREGRGAWTDVTQRPTLNAHARRELAANSRASRIPILLAEADTEPSIGAYIVGDQVGVAIRDGWTDIDGHFRVIARTIRLSDEGDEYVSLELAEIERFQ